MPRLGEGKGFWENDIVCVLLVEGAEISEARNRSFSENFGAIDKELRKKVALTVESGYKTPSASDDNDRANSETSIFEEGTTEEKGENARLAAFVGAIAVGDLVKSTLGPKGMDKILQSA
ncbi:hypothetical protein E4U53_002914, partial [Claviceps sorghi]